MTKMEVFSDREYNDLAETLGIDRYSHISIIDRDLLSMAFITRGYHLNPTIADRLDEKFNSTDYEWLEFIGDAIIEIIMTTLVTEIIGIGSLSDAHHVRQDMVKNTTLNCLMSKKSLCKYIRGKGDMKVCADVFEAIIGAIYWHLYYVEGMGYSSLDAIRKYMIEEWDIIPIMDNILDIGDTQCWTITHCPTCPVIYIPNRREFYNSSDKVDLVIRVGRSIIHSNKLSPYERNFIHTLISTISNDRYTWSSIIDSVYERLLSIAMDNDII